MAWLWPVLPLPPTAVLLALLLLLKGGLIGLDSIIVDAKSGVSGAGPAKQNILF